MAKRANPFIEDIVQQSKVHVGLKQFNNNEDRLKKVYEKTLELLFKGAKKSSALDVAHHVSDSSRIRKDKMKQLMIGRDGTLLHTGTVVADTSAPLQRCACGGSSSRESRCGYCETELCVACQRHCARCDAAYCSRCSLAGSEGAEVCVSCYN